jgi:Large polyvalent protein-associated domain 7
MATPAEESLPGADAQSPDVPTARKAPRNDLGSTSRSASTRPQRGEETENSIRPSRARTRRREPGVSVQESAAPQRPAASTSGPASTTGTDPWTVPASVRDRFTQEGHRFYFPDGARAFRDHGRKLSTPSENTELIRSLVEIAKVRGWDTVVVQGTDRFREEAWRQARLEGLTVRGYRPSEQERAALSRALARRQAAPEEGAPGRPAATSDAVAEPQRPTRSPGPGGTSVAVGKLLDHGRDTYHFDPHEEMSYFVRIQAAEGKRTFWGKDLQRAMDQSLTKPKIGEEVALKMTGQDEVTVKRRERGTDGSVLSEKDLATHRNRWVIEKREFFEAREAAAAVLRDPQIEAKTAVQSHPQLAGSYLSLHAAEIASKTLRDPEDQKRFVSLVRSALAGAVERGDPLQPVRLRERAQSRASERAQREPEAPARS